MSSPQVKFNNQDQPDFLKELRTKVNTYFQDNNISRYANFNMKFKTVFMLSLYFVPYILMLTGIVSGTWPVIGMWTLMGLGMSGIGLSIMHDANHKSYSRKEWVNSSLGFLLNFIGGYHVNWKIQHNVLHHSFTNVEGFDEDINAFIMRFSPEQPRKSFHKFQIIYAPILYGLMSIYWFVSKDFAQIIRYEKKDLLRTQHKNLRGAMIEIIIHKTWYTVLFLVLPLIFIAIPWWQIVLGFLLMHYITGLALALIFQPAHVIEETEFYTPDENVSVENSWAVHQLRTTANFARRSFLFSWFIGGLNFQIEHHLFPNICHIHYKKISKIVKETALEFNLPYHEHKTFVGALKSHFTLLHRLGTGKYDLMMASEKVMS